MKRTTYIKVSQLIVIVIAWMLVGFVIAVYDHLLLQSNLSLGPEVNYSFASACLRNVGAGLISGILGGSFLVFFINVKFQDKPYRYTMMAVSISFVLIVVIITLIMAFVTVPWRTGRPVTDPTTAIAVRDFIFDTAPLKALVVWYFVVLITQVFVLMNKKFGHGTFWHVITGRYNVPKRERRVFMFLDINSSTSLAEQLGSEKYHSFLRDFFSDITDPIINHHGSIYQYVGDEVVISWPIETEGICTRPLLCFSEIKELFLRKRKVYLQRYGVTPSFKAGVHAGHVVTGEIGIIKRDVTYSGDVLNATARIRDLCKEFNADLMVSHDFLDVLKHERRFTFIGVGKIKLRGKEQEMNLYIVRG